MIRAPLKFKNLTDKPITLILRRIDTQIGTSQSNYYCLDNTCMDQRIADYIIRLEAGQSLSSLQVALDAGLSPGVSSVKYQVHNRATPTDIVEFEVHFAVDERPARPSIYSSKVITVQDVYPNPVTDQANVDYRIASDRVKAKLVIHNILGNQVAEYDLPAYENKLKVRTDELNAGVYFYTLYVDNEGVMTRKLIV
ncbi:MAG: T9SS type A sorting domain-containing protein, partial [Bacteroidia bacterium]|nr:T9SS type A sorting domain-containing protein [Bacteroidia bacterium]